MKKVIVISGGSDGLGKAIAKQLSAGNTVIILSRSEEHLKKAADELNCEYKVCDVSDWNQVQKTIEQIVFEHKKIDCLINSAGIWVEGPLDQSKPEEISSALEINTQGTIFMCKAIIPQMKAQSEGTIINIISQAGLVGKALRTVYNASKWAITGFTKSLEPELAEFGIRVVGIYPGKLHTNMFEKVQIKKDMSDSLDPSAVAKTIEFILSFDKSVTFPEIGIKNREN